MSLVCPEGRWHRGVPDVPRVPKDGGTEGLELRHQWGQGHCGDTLGTLWGHIKGTLKALRTLRDIWGHFGDSEGTPGTHLGAFRGLWEGHLGPLGTLRDIFRDTGDTLKDTEGSFGDI